MKLANRHLQAGLLAFFIALILTGAMSAHEVGIQTEIEVRSTGGYVITYSRDNLPRNALITSVTVTVIYSTQEPMANGQIQIYAPGLSDTPWRTDRLDENGRYRFSPDLSKRGRWKIHVQSKGHSHFIDLMI